MWIEDDSNLISTSKQGAIEWNLLLLIQALYELHIVVKEKYVYVIYISYIWYVYGLYLVHDTHVYGHLNLQEIMTNFEIIKISNCLK